MIVGRSMHERWLSNAYVVGDAPGGTAVFVDSGAPLGPLLELVERENLTPTHLLRHAHAPRSHRARGQCPRAEACSWAAPLYSPALGPGLGLLLALFWTIAAVLLAIAIVVLSILAARRAAVPRAQAA